MIPASKQVGDTISIKTLLARNINPPTIDRQYGGLLWRKRTNSWSDQADRIGEQKREKRGVTELVGGLGAVGALPEREAGEELVLEPHVLLRQHSSQPKIKRQQQRRTNPRTEPPVRGSAQPPAHSNPTNDSSNKVLACLFENNSTGV